MRYYCYNEPVGNGSENEVITNSEEDIRNEYYPYWYEQMCSKYGKDFVDKVFSFENCLEDWIVINWAWEST